MVDYFEVIKNEYLERPFSNHCYRDEIAEIITMTDDDFKSKYGHSNLTFAISKIIYTIWHMRMDLDENPDVNMSDSIKTAILLLENLFIIYKDRTDGNPYL